MYIMSCAVSSGVIVSSIICLIIGKKQIDLLKALSLSCIITVIGTFGIILFMVFYQGNNSMIEGVLFLLLYTGVTTSFDLVYLVISDQFPTIFRATAYGVCHILGNAVTSTGPVVARLGGIWPLVILASLGTVGAILPMLFTKVK